MSKPEAIEGEVEPTPGEETPTPEPAPEPAARKTGYMSRDEWAESGKDPADYVTEEIFEVRGSFLKQINKLNRKIDSQAQDHEARMENQNKLHKIALTNTIKTLEGERDDAIDEADKTTANQKQRLIDDNKAVIDSLSTDDTTPAATPELAPEQVEWEANNQWIFDTTDPKANHAKALFAKIKNSGQVSNYPELFAELDKQMSQAFPEKPASQRQHRTSEKGSSTGSLKAGALNTNDITNDEAKYFSEYGWQVVAGKDEVKLPSGKVIKGVDKAAMMKMIKEARST